MLERAIQMRVLQYAERKGCFTANFSKSRIGFPDALVVSKGRILFIEFKRRGARPRPSQQAIHHALLLKGVVVVVVDNIRDGKSLINDLVSKRRKMV